MYYISKLRLSLASYILELTHAVPVHPQGRYEYQPYLSPMHTLLNQHVETYQFTYFSHMHASRHCAGIQSEPDDDCWNCSNCSEIGIAQV